MANSQILGGGRLLESPTRGRIDKRSPLPLYAQLEALLLERIKQGEWQPNDRLPAEHELAGEYGVSKVTVRQALAHLAHAGVLRREQGRGTFVAEPRLQQGPRELTSFSEEMRRRGLRPSSVVLEGELIAAGPSVAEKLDLRESDRVFRFKRLRLADGAPMGLQTAYVPADLAPGLLEADLAASSLYEVLSLRYGLVPVRAREIHCARVADAEEARWLGLPQGSAVLAAERVSFLENGRPLELVYSVMRGDRYQIVLDLTRAER